MHRSATTALALGVALLTPSAASAVESRWSVSVDRPLSARALELPDDASRATLARAAVERSKRKLVGSGRLGRLVAGPTPAAQPGSARVVGLRQSVGGLRVLWSQLTVTVKPGEVRSVIGTVVPLRSERLRGRVSIGARRASAIARRRITGADTALAPELVAYAGEPEAPRAARRAYVVEVHPNHTPAGEDSPTGFCVVVDAESGRVLKVWRGSAARPVERPRPRAHAAATQVLAQYVDAKGSAAVEGTALFSNWYDLVTNGNPYRYDSDGASFAAFGNPTPLASGNPPFRTAADTTTDVARYFCLLRNYCGRDSGLFGSYKRHFFTINWGGGTALYRPSQDRIYIPIGKSRDWQTASHELGHLIDHHFRRDYIDTFEGSEIQEALAEMFNYDYSAGRPAPPGAVISTTQLLEDPSTAPVVFPDGNGNKVKAPDHMKQFNCNATDEHLNGYILAHAYWKLAQGMGHGKAGRILQGIPWQLAARRTFGDVRRAFKVSIEAVYGIGSPEWDAYIAAFGSETGILFKHSREEIC